MGTVAGMIAPATSAAAEGGQASVNVTRSSGTCGWTAQADASWITLSSTSGADTAALGYSVSANMTTDTRTGRITISWTGGSSQLTVTQAGRTTPSACTYAIDPVGATWGNQAIEWWWHQWAQAEGAQRDPSAAASVVGIWGVYEDYLFSNYEKVISDSPIQTQWVPNQPGQSLGCEAPAHRTYSSNPPLYDWRGPDH